MKHTFLGWEKPCLPAVVDILIQRYKQGRYVDLTNLLLVFPSRAAGRRLLTLLAEEAYEHHLTIEPPRVKTAGDFPELLYAQKYPFASPLVQQIVWSRALQKFAKDQHLSPIFPNLPDQKDFLAWMELGKIISTMQQELAAEGLDFVSVKETWEKQKRDGEPVLNSEYARWEVLAQIQETYHAMLNELRLWDKQSARLYALRHPHPQRDFNIRFQVGIVGCVDLNRLQQQMLMKVGGNVEIFTFAPAELSDRFNQVGCILPEKWTETFMEIPDSIIHQVTKPEDQAEAVTDWLRELQGTYAADEITVGVIDDSLEPFITQRLRMEGISSQYAGGKELSTLGPWQLLSIWADWLETQRYVSFSQLIRHPDMTKYLNEIRKIPLEWIDELDTFYNNCLPEIIPIRKKIAFSETTKTSSLNPFPPAEELTLQEAVSSEKSKEMASPSEKFLPDITAENVLLHLEENLPDSTMETEPHISALKKVLEEFATLRDTLLKSANYHNAANIARNNGIRNHKYAVFASMVNTENLELGTHTAPLSVWACCVVDFLLKIYGWRIYHSQTEAEYHVARSCMEIRRIIIEEMQFPPCIMPKLKFTEALKFFLNHSSTSRLSMPSGSDTIDLRGWLELFMDDVPATILAGFNEGIIPQSRNEHIFLPNKLRKELGLETNETRCARDIYFLSVLLATRKNLRIIFGRVSPEGDFLLPSRLLLRGDDQTLAQRAKKFFSEADTPQKSIKKVSFSESSKNPDVHISPSEKECAPQSVYQIPAPRIPKTPKTKMSVSEFSDYLACPFRYYLRHYEKLQRVDDSAEEMGGGSFGTLAHAVLLRFGKEEIAARKSQKYLWKHTVEEETQRIIKLLDSFLEEEFSLHYGKNTISPVLIQKEQLRYRLHHFAHHQAQHTLDGWQIHYAEQKLENFFRSDAGYGDILHFPGGPMKISGIIDRIDYHPDQNLWAIWDYKTSDAGDSPDQAHLKFLPEILQKKGIPLSTEHWKNLQLPLYRHLAATILEQPETPFQLGYILLPKDPAKSGFKSASWTSAHLNVADETAQNVIQNIREGKFPRGESPDFEDEFTWIMKE
ncbi:MAG: PD-(D/E)XK nuclease family protein [Planctomycetia bacterium]|nr:PD-(D/E)XK nuclease family protein [Planctomycetia bacterium]